MGTTNVTNPLVQPSQNDLGGGVSGDGNTGLEKYMVKMLLAAGIGESYILSGGLLASSAANLISIVPSGVSFISGYYVTWPQTNVTLPSSSTSHLFVALTFASGLVTGVQIIDNTSGTPPSDSVKLGTQTTSGSAITAAVDQRLLARNRKLPSSVRVTATGSWRCPEGVTAVLAHLRGAGAGGGGGGGGRSVGGVENGESGDVGSHGLPGEDVWRMLTVTPGTSYTLTIGTGGSGGGGGAADNNGSNGNDGADTTFGALATAKGGKRGIGGLAGGAHSATFSFPTAVGLSTTHGVGDGQPGLGGAGGNGGVGGGGSSGTTGGNGRDGFIEIYF